MRTWWDFGRWSCLVVATIALTAPNAATAQDIEEGSPEAEALDVIRRLFDGLLESDTAVIRSAFVPGFPGLASSSRGQDGVARVNFASMDEWLTGIAGAAPGSLEEKYTVAQARVDDGLVTVVTPYGFFFNGNLSHCGVDVFLIAETEAGWKIAGLADTRRRQGCEDWIDD